ncbi:hypothetical protein E1292_44965 [Nonomuraea deserti]|uniref:Fibronectin type-III domain-containing protein n=1 Tax=Nonomuraea deserti TaxID=1848322 RepID=A0A4R4UBR1_9ACTN|nr:carbohydrate binding domain-containing protein [Nonomuraea deserti]TDC89018.1 hypothetical protein E1292_44965 [Nonomuraea deserti]
MNLRAATAALALGLATLHATPAQAANILPNPGFESGLSGWTCTAGAQAVASPVHGGAAALRATPQGGDLARCGRQVSVRPSSSYTLSAWVQGGYVFLGATGTGGADPQTWGSPGAAWTQLRTTFTTGPSATDDVGVTRYEVSRDGGSPVAVTGTSHRATGLSADTTYRFKVRACDAAGNCSAYSPEASGTTAAAGNGGDGGLPEPVLVGYLHASFANGSGYVKMGEVPEECAMRDDLTLLHVQDYNSGPIMGLDGQYHTMGGHDFHVAMTDMLLAGFPIMGDAANVFPPLRQDQVAIGLPASVNAGNGYTTVTEVQKAFGCLATGTGCGTYRPRGVYPGLRGLMAWSINWDRHNGYEFSRNHRAYLDGLT